MAAANDRASYDATAASYSHTSEGTTATIDDLISELNTEHAKVNGELFGFRSLRRTLEFLNRSIGLMVRSKDDALPIDTLKNIKLLFQADSFSKKNVLALLAPPHAPDDATMEFSTVTTIPRDADASMIIASLLDHISLEMAPTKLRMFEELVGHREAHSVAEKLLLHAERANDESLHLLRQTRYSHDSLLARTYRKMSKHIDDFRAVPAPEHDASVSEKLYVYLQTLSFQHFVAHHSRHVEETRIRREVGSIGSEANLLCGLAAGNCEPHHTPSDRVFSVRTMHHLIRAWPDEMAQLVQTATGIDTSAKQLKPHEDRAKVLLASYAYRSFDCEDPDAPVLSVYDIVAALASFRYQQEAGEDYKPYWPGQTDQGKSPQRHFDSGLNKEDPHQHQGVLQIYLNRFYEYQAAFKGTTESHQAWMGYQTSVLNAYQSVLKLNNIKAITVGLTALNQQCGEMARAQATDQLTAAV